MNQEEMQKIIAKVEKELVWEFTKEEIDKTFEWTMRKAILNKVDDDYIPLMFEDELRYSVIREAINYMGRKNRDINRMKSCYID